MLSESFELHFRVYDIDSDDKSSLEDRGDVRAVLEELSDLDICVDGAEVDHYGYGYGADGYAIGIVLSGLVTLFFSGKRIEENLDAWIRLGERFKQAIQRLRRSKIHISVSEPTALAIAVHQVSEDVGGQVPILVLSSTVVKVRNSSLSAEAKNIFLEHPDRYYVFGLQVGESYAHVIALNTSGRVLFNNVLSLEQWAYETLR